MSEKSIKKHRQGGVLMQGVSRSGHEDRDERQQENQDATTNRQDDGHEGNDGFDHIGGLTVGRGGMVGHVFSS